jgi:glucan phosphoethanolaminetransferase (alkaline phosphatase superfamily)
MPKRIPIMALKFFVILTILILCSENWFIKIVRMIIHAGILPYMSLASSFKNYSTQFFYILMIFLCFLSFFFIPYLKSKYLRITLVLAIIISFWAEYLFYTLTGTELNITTMEMIWTEKDDMGSTMILYYLPRIVSITALSIFFAFILSWEPPKHLRIPSYFGIIPLLTVWLSLYPPHGFVIKLDPIELPPFSSLTELWTVIGASQRYNGPRENIAYSQPLVQKIKNIVFIVDESVRGDYLSINNANLNTTPYLKDQSTALISFGQASSGANCSAPSRYILRTGLQPSDLPDLNQKGLRKPALWQYAAHAGYKTVFITSFPIARSLATDSNSFMNVSEKKFINHIVPIASHPFYMRDSKIADEILEALKDEKPTFIFVEKQGMHFPYSHFYPATYSSSEGVLPNPDLTNPDELRSSYRIGIQWTVDEFFKKLLPSIDLGDTLLVYTSDHGQSLALQEGSTIMHCNIKNIHAGEGNVPLVVMTKNPQLETLFRSAAEKHFNRASHFQLFPTLLWAMGYDPDFSHSFGESLLSPPHEEPWKFFAGSVFAPQRYTWVVSKSFIEKSNIPSTKHSLITENP